MKKITSILILLLGIFALSSSNFSDLNLRDIVYKAENRLRGKSSIATSKITIVRPKYTREMKLKSWSKGEDYSLTYIMSPARDEGLFI